jgi:hypothetical protein
MSERTTTRRQMFMLGGLCALLLCASAARAASKDFHTVETKHYVVQTDVSREFTRIVSEHMEAIYQQYTRCFESFDLKDHERFTVKVFARRRDYRGSVPPKLDASAGAFSSGDRLLAAFLENRSQEEVFRTLYHEGFHQFLFSRIARDVPIWVNEGFAEYFAAATWNGKEFTLGQVPGQDLHLLQQTLERGNYIPLKQLFAMDTDMWINNLRRSDGRANVQYVEAWSVVHFLTHAREGSYRTALLSYLKRISGGVDQRKAFAEAIGSDVRGFERAWKSYVRGLKPGAQYRCMRNMRVVGRLSIMFYEDPTRFRSIKDLYQKATSERVRWYVETPDGVKISSDNPGQVKAVLKCPEDSSRRPTSFVLLRNSRTNLPEMYCTHHPGIVIKMYYDRQDDGKYRVRTERIVRDTLHDALLRALRRR